MRGGFRALVNPPSRISEVDLEATREARQELHRQLRLRAHLLDVFTNVGPGDERVQIAEGPSTDEVPTWGPDAA